MSVEMSVPEIRFKGYSENWSIEKFKNVTKINQGLQIEISSRYTQKVENSYFYITNEFLKEGSDYKYYIVNPPVSVLCDVDDVLMTRTGNTGHVVTNISGAFHNNFFKIKFDKKKLDKNFIVHYLKWSKTQKIILRSAGSSTIPDLNHNDFYNIEIAYSKIEEQTAIGNTFQKLDSLINQHQQKHDKLSNIKKAMLEKMFPKQGKTIPEIRFKGFSEDWQEKELKEICTYHSSTLTVNDAEAEGKYELYDAQKCIGYTDRNIQDSDYITIIKDGSGVGRVRVLPKNSSFIATMGAIKPDESNLHFLYGCFIKIDFNKHISGATIPHVYFRDYGREKFRVPTIEEQTSIGNYFQKLDALINQHQQQITKLGNIKQACLSKMFV